jgi:hypothetical protein
MLDTYVPSALVQYIHAFPHPGGGGGEFQTEFLYDHGKSKYPTSVAALGANTVGIMLGMVLALCATLWARRFLWKGAVCQKCSLACTVPMRGRFGWGAGKLELNSSGTRPLLVLMVFGLATCLIFAWSCFGMKSQLDGAVHNVTLEMSQLSATFFDTEKVGGQLLGMAAEVEASFAQADCEQPYGQLLKLSSHHFTENVTSLNNDWRGISADVAQFSVELGKTWPVWAAVMTNILVGLVAAPAAVSILAAFVPSASLKLTACCIGVLALILQALFFGGLLSFTVTTADFCMAPDYNAQSTFQNLGLHTYYKLSGYYMTCAGANPLNGNIHHVQAGIQAMLKSVSHTQAISPSPCAHPQGLHAARQLSKTALGILGTMQADAKCNSVQQVYQSLVYSTVCHETMKHSVWMLKIQAISWSLLLATLFMAVFVHSEETGERETYITLESVEPAAFKANASHSTSRQEASALATQSTVSYPSYTIDGTNESQAAEKKKKQKLSTLALPDDPDVI